MISTLILTKNEARDLPACLQSLTWCDDIHVFDSYSTDATIEIARRYGAHVYQRRFENYASQRNAALATVPFRHKWIFILDADERPSPELSVEMQQSASSAPAGINAFRMERRDYFWETWLKHAQMSPLYIRLIRAGYAQYSRPINEVLEVEGKIWDLHSPLLHFPFSKGISHWISRHDVYSTREAQLIFQRESLQKPSLRKALFSGDFHERRLHQKAIFYQMRGRPLIKLFYLLFIKRALLDGPAGVSYSLLQAFYEFMIVLKTRELMREIPKQAPAAAEEEKAQHSAPQPIA